MDVLLRAVILLVWSLARESNGLVLPERLFHFKKNLDERLYVHL